VTRHLAKHLKQMHPGDTIAYECSACGYRGKLAYPKKDVAKHYTEEHSVPRTKPGPVPGGARPRESGVRTPARGLVPRPRARNSERRRRAVDESGGRFAANPGHHSLSNATTITIQRGLPLIRGRHNSDNSSEDDQPPSSRGYRGWVRGARYQRY